MKNRLKNKTRFKVFYNICIAILLSTITTLHAAECYEEYRKSCIENNGPKNLSSAFSCTMNEQVFTKTMYDEFDSYNVLDLDETIAYHSRVVKGEDGGDAIYSRFAVCYYQTYKKYRQTGLKPNPNQASKQSSSSGSSSQSSKKASQQATDSQSNQSNTSTPTASSQNQSNPQSNSSNVDSNTGLSMKSEQEALVNTASQKYASESAAFDASHKGLKRTHNKEDEASRCLVIENKKIKNTCDYRVEYTFCAYKPNLKAFSAAFEMAAAFDCEQRKFGSAGISAKRVDAGTYTAEAVYVFGCKDPSLPRGVTYERGRGLSGRCSE